MGRARLARRVALTRWRQLHLGISQYGLGSKAAELINMKGCLSAAPLNTSTHFSFSTLIYSGLGWQRGLDSAWCRTKDLQCRQYYSDPISALSPMRSPQCYVSLTEKYSHTDKRCCLARGSPAFLMLHRQEKCTRSLHTHTHTHTHSYTHIKRGYFVSIWDSPG